MSTTITNHKKKQTTEEKKQKITEKGLVSRSYHTALRYRFISATTKPFIVQSNCYVSRQTHSINCNSTFDGRYTWHITKQQFYIFTRCWYVIPRNYLF